MIIPEIVYVKDIYSGSYKRFNTMFKLTYQAFILFAMMQAQIISRALADKENSGRRKAGICAVVLLVLCSLYFPVAVDMGIGRIGPKGEMKGLASDGYVYDMCPMDALAIDWIKTNLEKGSVVLEANGDSYTIYNRVSTLTGMPTILGWHTHEWLWQNDADVVDDRADDVEAIYLGKNAAAIKQLTDKYAVDYIFIGSCEYDKYLADGMDVELLKSLGEVVYDGGGTQPVIIIKL